MRITDTSYFYKFKVQIDSSEELSSVTQTKSAVYSGILNLINYNAKGLIDWKNTSKLSFNSKLEDHHIFPREYLKTNYKKDEDALELIDSVSNKTLIPKLTNIKIGKRPPSDYLTQLERDNPDLKECLQQHLIPEGTLEGLYDDDYKIFLEDRARSVFSLIKTNVLDVRDRIIEEFYQEPKLGKDKTETVKVFATYNDKTVEAEFNLSAEKITYNGRQYSVSGAGSAAKKDLIGKDTSTNGWQFWKFRDDQNQEKYIEELRSKEQKI
jgi:hypothetical protein